MCSFHACVKLLITNIYYLFLIGLDINLKTKLNLLAHLFAFMFGNYCETSREFEFIMLILYINSNYNDNSSQ